MVALRLGAISLLVHLVLAPWLRAQDQFERPRLVVLCSVDQLARWVLDRGLPHMGQDGFNRVLREGVDFSQCAFWHACTETGPGHSTLVTGAPASVHGIVRNDWWDRSTGRTVYCADDQTTHTLVGLPIGIGVGPGNLRVPTLGDMMKDQFGATSRVVSVSWKDRSAILMGGKGADLALWLSEPHGLLITNSAYVDATPAWVAEMNRKGPFSPYFNWVWERSGSPEAYVDLVDDRSYELTHPDGTKTLPQVLNGGLPTPGSRFYTQCYGSPAANQVIQDVALTALGEYELGQDAVPDFLCISFSGNDTTGHDFGPNSHEARDVLLRTDLLIAKLLDTLDQRVGQGKYLFVLSADHGVSPIPEARQEAGESGGRGFLHRAARLAAETAMRKAFVKSGAEFSGRFILRSLGAMLYLNRELLVELGVDLDKAARVAAAAAVDVQGVGGAWATADLLGADELEDPVARSVRYAIDVERCGDVMMSLAPYWLEGATRASHGTPHSYDREVPLLISGPGVARGVEVTAAVSPGMAAIVAAQILGLPRPPGARETIPEGVLVK